MTTTYQFVRKKLQKGGQQQIYQTPTDKNTNAVLRTQ